MQPILSDQGIIAIITFACAIRGLIRYFQGRPRLKKALANAYSKSLGRELDPETEVSITTGANEGMLSAFMAFIEPGDEVIIFEPFFDQSVYSVSPKNSSEVTNASSPRYISNIEMPGGTIRYVPLHPPKDGATRTSSAGEWKVDFDQLEQTINSKTKMIVR